MSMNWTCPHCSHAVTITEDRRSIENHVLEVPNSVGRLILHSIMYVCPNNQCRKPTVNIKLDYATVYNFERSHWVHVMEGPVALSRMSLYPLSAAKSFPEYVPKAIRDDYEEACSIVELSPKASATLSRRCLQGILRDFWSVRPENLIKEIEQVKEKMDPMTWEAIDAVRHIGNIGAHMEKDINIIVDVDPDEASMLVTLIETLIKEWYINREERRVQMDGIKKVAAAKKLLAKPPPAAGIEPA